jgi:hypothetical protein
LGAIDETWGAIDETSGATDETSGAIDETWCAIDGKSIANAGIRHADFKPQVQTPEPGVRTRQSRGET